MPDELHLANARLVLENEVVTGSLRLDRGRIMALDQGAGVPAGAVDCKGDYVAAGLIELHTDNLERHMHPRPGVAWPQRAAVLAHDAELAGAGITTVFNALRVGFFPTGPRAGRQRSARVLADEIGALRRQGALKISHILHLRAEICSETLVEELKEFGPDDQIGIVSMMDHTPGQRQFTDLAKFETHLRGKYDMTKAEFEAHVAFRLALRNRVGDAHEAAVAAAADRFGAVLASHDDTTCAQVEASAERGVRLAEFPTTLAAARACRGHGIAVIAGAPNLVRGQSHSGNVQAAGLAAEGLVDVLSSDYVPAALLAGAVRAGAIAGNLARGMAMVTSAPARLCDLADRGTLEAGKRADLIRFRLLGDVPVLRAVWAGGRRVG